MPPEPDEPKDQSPEAASPEVSMKVNVAAPRAEDPAALDERAETAKTQVAAVIDEMHAVLAEDLPAFPGREGKKRFLDAPEAADKLSGDELAALKRDLREVADTVCAEVVSSLQAHEPWLHEQASVEEGGARVLDGSPEVAGAFHRVARATQAVLERRGLASAEKPVRYKTPTWFIEGRYMPGLIEKYWRWLSELQEIEREKARTARETERRSLAERWEEA